MQEASYRWNIPERKRQLVFSGKASTEATHLLSGAMNEAILWIARSPEPRQALDETITVLEQLLDGL